MQKKSTKIRKYTVTFKDEEGKRDSLTYERLPQARVTASKLNRVGRFIKLTNINKVVLPL